jgi:hypothetical protein
MYSGSRAAGQQGSRAAEFHDLQSYLQILTALAALVVFWWMYDPLCY